MAAPASPEPVAVASASFVPRLPARPSPGRLVGVSAWLTSHLAYPETATRLGRQGTVTVRFTVERDGRVADVGLVSGSSTTELDEAAAALVREAHLPPFPPELEQGRQTITVPIHYRLD